MTTTDASELIDEMMEAAQHGSNVELQPNILLSQEIDPAKVETLTSCYVNGSWESRIQELLDNGWMLIRVQTEFGPFGHDTMAYFAKLKAN